MSKEYELPYTGEQIEEKLHKIEPTGVEAGTYGGYNSGAYYIPNIAVDAYGRVTAVSNSTLAEADKGPGLMSYKHWSYLTNNTHLGTSAIYTFSNDTLFHQIPLSNVQCTNVSLTGGAYLTTPAIYAVYAYIHPVNSEQGIQAFTPVPYYVTASYDSKTSTTTVYVNVKLTEELVEANSSSETIPFVVLYERTYDSVSIGM